MSGVQPEAVFLVMCDSSMNELWVTKATLVNELQGTKIFVLLVTSHPQKVDL